MLHIARNLGQLSFGKLMEIYLDGNRENGVELAPEDTEERQLQLAEENFYTYLHDSFFKNPGAVYYIWEEAGDYVSALRLEPYNDGLLLEALETAPDKRRQGYAVKLIDAVLSELSEQGSVCAYSHVSKKNIPSLKTHQHCGFQIILDYAAYIDGSVNHRAYTLQYKKTKNCKIRD